MGTPPVMPPLHWMPPPPPMMGGPFGRHAVMWLFDFIISLLKFILTNIQPKPLTAVPGTPFFVFWWESRAR